MRSCSRAWRRRWVHRGDDGFSLMESVVALMVAALVFSSLSVALLQTVRGSNQARQNQNAADLLNKQVEYVRSLNFAGATELTSDLAGDPNLTQSGGAYYLSTSAGQEPVVAASVGLIPLHTQTVTVQGTVYTVSTYITQVTDTNNAAANYRRVTVIATWTVNGRTHSRRTSSFFTDTRRGLPLPRFTMGTATTVKTNVGATLALKVKITNVGAPDAFNLSASIPASGGTWSWYSDSNGDGVYTMADSALSDVDGDGVKDTGILQVGTSITMFAVRTIAVGEASTQSVTLTAISSAQPTATTASQSFTDMVLVNPAACSGCTLTTYYMHNSGSYSSTVYQSTAGSNTPMSLDKTAPAGTRLNLYDYSTDCFTLTALSSCNGFTAGRHVRVGGGSLESDKTKVAAWYYSVPSATTLAGTASVSVWVRAADGSASASTITAYVGSDQNNSISGGNFNPAGSGTITLPATTSAQWQAVTIGVPLSGTLSINVNKYLGVRIVSSGALDVRLAYDTTTYNAQATLPIVSGG